TGDFITLKVDRDDDRVSAQAMTGHPLKGRGGELNLILDHLARITLINLIALGAFRSRNGNETTGHVANLKDFHFIRCDENGIRIGDLQNVSHQSSPPETGKWCPE